MMFVCDFRSVRCGSIMLYDLAHREREVRERQDLVDVGLSASERMCIYDEDRGTPSKKRHKYDTPDGEENVCDRSKKICYLSMVSKVHFLEASIMAIATV